MLNEVDRFAFASVAITTRALLEAAGRSELTFLGWRVLVILGTSDDSLRLRELSERLGASAPSTSRLVRRLERRGLVTTAPDAVDRRGLRVGLSENGERLHDAVLDRRRELLSEALDAPLPSGAQEVISTLADRLSRWV